MVEEKPQCRCAEGKPGERCPLCGVGEQELYWCEVCKEAVDAKRCPLCGLKTKRMRR